MSTNFEDPESDLSNWISQAEAARLQSVSRQAINKLVQSGRIRSREIGGHVLVSRTDLNQFRPQPSGRPKSSESRDVERVKRLIDVCSPEDRQEILVYLKSLFPPLALETRLNASAELILEAIDLSGDLTIRMIRGVIAEAAFRIHVVRKLPNFQSLQISGDQSFDYVLQENDFDPVRVQVKLQRSIKNEPMLTKNTGRKNSYTSNMFVVETQRTRSGRVSSTGELTRPYRFNEFDILAVCMYPSTRKWNDFRYTLARWLIRKPHDASLLATFQPLPTEINDDWTDDFETCAAWLREGSEKTIRGKETSI